MSSSAKYIPWLCVLVQLGLLFSLVMCSMCLTICISVCSSSLCVCVCMSVCVCVCCIPSQGWERRHAGSIGPWTECCGCLKIPWKSKRQNHGLQQKVGYFPSALNTKCAQQSVECYLWGRATRHKSHESAQSQRDAIIFSLCLMVKVSPKLLCLIPKTWNKKWGISLKRIVSEFRAMTIFEF